METEINEYTLLLKDETARDEKVQDASPFNRREAVIGLRVRQALGDHRESWVECPHLSSRLSSTTSTDVPGSAKPSERVVGESVSCVLVDHRVVPVGWIREV